MEIVFVDGPTGSGKDYFIDGVISELAKMDSGIKVTTFSAADMVLKNNKAELRKYTQYKTPVSAIQDILEAHISLLDHANTLSICTDNDLVLVNRSILSAYIYNIKPIIEEIESINDRNLFTAVVRENYKEFKDKIASLSSDHYFSFVKITPEGATIEDKIRTVLTRVRARKDNKQLDENWMRYMVTEYEKDWGHIDAFDRSVILSSSDYAQEAQRIMRRIHVSA